jgi:hypothetical protein
MFRDLDRGFVPDRGTATPYQQSREENLQRQNKNAASPLRIACAGGGGVLFDRDT